MHRLIALGLLAAAAVSTPADAQSQYYLDCIARSSGFAWPWDPVRLAPEACRYFDALRAGAAGEPGSREAFMQAQKDLEAASKRPMPLPGVSARPAAAEPAPPRYEWTMDDQRR